MVLDLCDLWTTIDGTISQPPLSAPPEDLAKWSHNDHEAHAQITLTLKDEPLNSVLDASIAKECWDMLASCYEGKGEQSIVHLIDKVFHRTLSDSKALEPQINALTRAAHTVTNLGLMLNTRLVALAIIFSLPPSLSTLQTILSASPPANLIPVYVLSQVTLNEQCHVCESGMGATAFFAKAVKKGKGKDKKSEDKFKKHCTHCKIHGHDVNECHKLKKELEAKGGTSNTPSLKPTALAKVANTDFTPANTTVQLFTAHIDDSSNSNESTYAFSALSAPNLQH
jgi:LTR polyprotein gag-polypeptide-like protein